jgi:hypothetical protein
MNLRGSLPVLALGGTMLAALAGTAQAQLGMSGGQATVDGAADTHLIRLAHERGGWERGGWDRGRGERILEFNDIAFGAPAPYQLAEYGGGCRFLRMKWHQTGRRYWLRRYEECREG